jgi:hypothetical protein
LVNKTDIMDLSIINKIDNEKEEYKTNEITKNLIKNLDDNKEKENTIFDEEPLKIFNRPILLKPKLIHELRSHTPMTRSTNVNEEKGYNLKPVSRIMDLKENIQSYNSNSKGNKNIVKKNISVEELLDIYKKIDGSFNDLVKDQENTEKLLKNSNDRPLK